MQLRPFTRGCRYLQFDDTNWAFLADQTKQEELRAKEYSQKKLHKCTTINEALAGKPEDLTVTTFAVGTMLRLGYFQVVMNR